MKKLLLILPIVALSACASSKYKLEDAPPEPVSVKKVVQEEEFPTVPDFDVRAMSRAEVISAIDQCEASGMKPFVEYLNQRTRYGKVMVPVNVHCNPHRKVH